MRRNYPANSTTRYRNWDRVYVDLPQCPLYSRLVVSPMKAIFINRCADRDKNIDRMFRSVEDFTDFCDQYWIDLP